MGLLEANESLKHRKIYWVSQVLQKKQQMGKVYANQICFRKYLYTVCFALSLDLFVKIQRKSCSKIPDGVQIIQTKEYTKN
jgi:hypothetical protein